ncbi:MAG: hypothetical protein LBS31_05110 [Candidatus Adiutrix sp.]|jgi:hypothetical protein|nr:hypothetical protein [Candidatus Adiutrix sp.]
MAGKINRPKGAPAAKRVLEPGPESPPGSNLTLHPKISLAFVQPGRYALNKCTKDEKAALVDKLHNLCALTWKQIYNAGRHGLGFEKVEVKKAAPPEIFKDHNQVAFRFCGKKPMVGFIDHDTFYIVWFDHDFTLYRHD